MSTTRLSPLGLPFGGLASYQGTGGGGGGGTPPPGGDPSVPGSNHNRSPAHRAWFCLVPFLLLLTACEGSELIGPAHPEYEARCTLYVEDEGWVDMPREMIEGCLSVRLQVIRWED